MVAAIWWIRRDFRLDDNPALEAALAYGSMVIPVFVLDPFFEHLPYVGEKRYAFMLGGLRALDESLRERGSRLVVRRGHPREVLAQLIAETGASAIFAQEDFSIYARRRDGDVAGHLPLTLTGGLSAQPVEAVRKADGNPYTVFTPFSKAWKALAPIQLTDLHAAPAHIPTPTGIRSLPIPAGADLLSETGFIPGEREALRRLKAFTQGDAAPIYAYADARNRLDLDGTSGLSPYLRWGMLSPRRAVATAQEVASAAHDEQARRGAETWLNELIWREFCLSILYTFPHVMSGSFRPEYDAIRWLNHASDFRAWCEGGTGYPVVDAGMRQLRETGWMHNRVRMIVASFLVKDLLINWRWGERWFMQHLVDGDPAANNGGWQWTAGTGTDAAPYFRIFNPISQAEKFDPDGAYVRRWVPELRGVPARAVHRPWRLSDAEQRTAGCIIGRDYPAPIIDHDAARRRALEAYKVARSG